MQHLVLQAAGGAGLARVPTRIAAVDLCCNLGQWQIRGVRVPSYCLVD